MTIKLLAILLALLLASPAMSQAGDAEPAPTAEVEAEAALENPFLQDDLELLVGNVQRPNGIAWYEGSLFTVCNGDWTIYKIDDTHRRYHQLRLRHPRWQYAAG